MSLPFANVLGLLFEDTQGNFEKMDSFFQDMRSELTKSSKNLSFKHLFSVFKYQSSSNSVYFMLPEKQFELMTNKAHNWHVSLIRTDCWKNIKYPIKMIKSVRLSENSINFNIGLLA